MKTLTQEIYDWRYPVTWQPRDIMKDKSVEGHKWVSLYSKVSVYLCLILLPHLYLIAFPQNAFSARSNGMLLSLQTGNSPIHEISDICSGFIT